MTTPPVEINIDPYYAGDSWIGMTVGPVIINEDSPANTLTSVRMQFRDRKTGDLGFELNTSPGAGEGTITISNASTWLIVVPAQILVGLVKGNYKWDFECTDSTGYVITLYKGKLRVIGDVTHD